MNVLLDLSGEVCPAPLVKSRRAMDKIESGETMEIVVTGDDSKVNITMAAEELGMDTLRTCRDSDGKWHLIITKR